MARSRKRKTHPIDELGTDVAADNVYEDKLAERRELRRKLARLEEDARSVQARLQRLAEASTHVYAPMASAAVLAAGLLAQLKIAVAWSEGD